MVGASFESVSFFLSFVMLNHDDSREILRYKYGTLCRGTRVEVSPAARTQRPNTLVIVYEIGDCMLSNQVYS